MLKIWPRCGSTTSQLHDLLLHNIIHNNSTTNECISLVFPSSGIFRYTLFYFPLAYVHQAHWPPWFNHAKDSSLLIIPKYLAAAIIISINNTWRGHIHLRVDGQLIVLWYSVCLPSFDGIQHSFLSVSVPWSVDRLLDYYDLGCLQS